MARLALTLFGGIQARIGERRVAFPRRKAMGLLAYLALHADQLQARDKLAALLWGEAPDERARHSLRQTLLTLRHTLGARYLIERGDGVALQSALLDMDVTRFEQLAADGRPGALEEAAVLYGGPLLDGFQLDEESFEDWLRHERERLRQRALDVLSRLLAHQDRSQVVDQAVQTALRLLAVDPVQEPVHRMLMRLYASQGQRGRALRQYQTCVDVLDRELGVEPEPLTRRLYHGILKSVPAPGSAVPDDLQARRELVSARSEASAAGASIVGRETELGALYDALDRAWQGHGHVALIAGESGIGKTRLVETIGAEAVGRGGQLLIGRCHENDQVLPLGPWVDAFRPDHVMTALADLLGMRPLLAHCHATLALLARRSGDATGATDHAAAAAQLYGALGITPGADAAAAAEI